MYAVGRSVDDKVGVYRLENKLLTGTGKFSFKNVEGLSRSPKGVRDSITAAFNYFSESLHHIVCAPYGSYDYSMYFNDLQNRNVSNVADREGLYSR